MEYPDNTSIMLTSPLIPTKDDLVELASSDFMPFSPSAYDTEGTVVEEGEEEEREKIPEAGWMDVWPLTMFMGAGSSARVESKPSARVGKPQQQQRVWTPSKDKLSIEAMWWGYRIYLPPPVLLILSDRQLEATKRAALITTALTWFFNNLPVSSLPLPVQPVVILLQRLVPYLGYIGTFISWSWGTIKGYDKGSGVTLTATWILPFALIPGSFSIVIANVTCANKSSYVASVSFNTLNTNESYFASFSFNTDFPGITGINDTFTSNLPVFTSFSKTIPPRHRFWHRRWR
ncbi:hypothetical protein BDN72DRAFT_842319 [Pluteus cervinus]|uniref:Uncharacterized protein n=1 Tax=Pluteus cervinus TaxID=181527 RepID=A0ACD3ARS2_9AGAR|nr:hypothetical protein BDN72DRAFT_842319 [Pluteus cervinus]